MLFPIGRVAGHSDRRRNGWPFSRQSVAERHGLIDGNCDDRSRWLGPSTNYSMFRFCEGFHRRDRVEGCEKHMTGVRRAFRACSCA
jgi:hypothetical protein